jgi:Ni,Fe-hydrogenase maturation factor
MADPEFWAESARPGPQVIAVDGGELRRGSRVRLHPRPGGDVFDLTLAGRVATVEGIDHDLEGGIHVAVTLCADPGRDLGEARQPGHRFFFAVDEVELIPPEPGASPAPARILVAGIGNIFLGDDGFGVEVARRLLERPPLPGIDVVDFGIRGLDLAYALQTEYDALILVDAAPRGHHPGTLSVIEPVLEPPRRFAAGPTPGSAAESAAESAAGSSAERMAGQAALEPHAMDPARVLHLARSLGAELPPVRLIACEPGVLEPAEGGDLLVALSEPVRAAVEPAIELVLEVVAELETALAARHDRTFTIQQR